ncbi:MAG: PfkB family carbohydrate kinase [Bacillota bacterium]
MRLAAIGDNCIDVYTNKGMAYPGGGPVNFAVQARRLGAETAYIGVVGGDEHGRWLADALAAEGVETTHLTVVEGDTAVAYVRLEGAERTFIGSQPGVRGQLAVTPETERYLSGFDLIHTTLDGRVDEHIPAWHQAGKRISYDFSHRARPEQLALLPHIECAFFSGQKVRAEDGPALLKEHHGRGATLAVMTFGEEGSLAYDGHRLYYQPALPASVVDTLGAGDSFQAGFVVAYLQTESIQAALAAGAATAVRAISNYGGFGQGRPTPTDLVARTPQK